VLGEASLDNKIRGVALEFGRGVWEVQDPCAEAPNVAGPPRGPYEARSRNQTVTK